MGTVSILLCPNAPACVFQRKDTKEMIQYVAVFVCVFERGSWSIIDVWSISAAAFWVRLVVK